MNYRKAITPFALCAILTLQACGASNFATTLRLVVAAGAPILDMLQRQGKISPELRAGLITDLSNETLPISAMSGCFDGILKDDPQSKVKHLQCVQALERAPETRKLISDFKSNSAVSQIADDFDSVLEAAIIFYGGAGNVMRDAGPAMTEADVQARIKKLKADLGQK